MADHRRSHCTVTVTFQPFTRIAGVKRQDVPFYGGSIGLADYCPLWEVSGTNVVKVFYLLHRGFRVGIVLLML